MDKINDIKFLGTIRAAGEDIRPENPKPKREKIVKDKSALLDDCEMSVRAINGLKANEIYKVEDLANYTEKELAAKLRNPKTMAEIKDVLAEFDLAFKSPEA